ncbi:MAG: diguanylate cyclase [Myxococcota bacterium]
MDTREMVINLIIYVILPLWGLSGLLDWFCHRATKIEETTGLRESLLHSLMGLQIGLPIVLCIVFEVNVMVLMICLASLIAHEVVAHMDVHIAAPEREISIWEVHAHNYLATIPFYSFALIAVLKWEEFISLLTFDWAGGFGFELRPVPIGGSGYLPAYLAFMCVVCVFPYIEELYRCLRGRRSVA